jgi:hypothetical protein
MSISISDALRIATAKHNQRLAKREKQLYTLHFSNDGTGIAGVIHGTKKSIIDEFKRTKSSYNVAVITKKGQSEYLYVYNRAWGSKFMMMRDKKPSVRK